MEVFVFNLDFKHERVVSSLTLARLVFKLNSIICKQTHFHFFAKIKVGNVILGFSSINLYRMVLKVGQLQIYNWINAAIQKMEKQPTHTTFKNYLKLFLTENIFFIKNQLGINPQYICKNVAIFLFLVYLTNILSTKCY